MDDLLWWIGVTHAIAYLIAGTVFMGTWLMWRTLRYLGLWKRVYQGLREKSDRERGFHGAGK